MRWNIVTDSSCDLFPANAGNEDINLSCAPFIISVGNEEFIDDKALDTRDMLDAMESCKEASYTSCPSPQNWIEQFERAERSIAVTISSGLSGSMNSAMLAKEIVLEKYPDKQIAVLDSFSTGPEITMCVEKIIEYIKAGFSFERVVCEAKAYLMRTHIIFALSSFDNLIKNGRISKVAGFIARKLGMWGIGVGSDEGDIAMKGKARGPVKAISMLLDDMKEHGFRGGKVVISHCHNLALAEKLRDRIQTLWSGSEVRIMTTRGLCSFYAERGGLILSY